MKTYAILVKGILGLAVFCAFAISGFAQTRIDLPESLGASLGHYKTNSPVAAVEFKDFEGLYLSKFPGQDTDQPKRDSAGRVFIQGELRTNDKRAFSFKKAFIKIVKIKDEDCYRDVEFETNKVNGISYKFKGKFAENSILEQGNYITLRGKLTIYQKDKVAGSVELAFYEYAIL